jgi:tRNA G37 N-methylase Trm5
MPLYFETFKSERSKGEKMFDNLGNIAILKFPDGTSRTEKLRAAKKILRNNITTVLEKAGKIKGRLRTLKTRYLFWLK